MPLIDLPPGLAGIAAGFAFRPEIARPMQELAHVLMSSQSPVSCGERELIATFVSARNGCYYCEQSHGATAACHLGGNASLVEAVKQDSQSAAISPKLRALLTIAGKVQEDGKKVTHEDVECARNFGATDREIHDTVLIAAAFCMYNRYVDGLGTWQPIDPAFYAEMGHYDATNGYLPIDSECNANSAQN